MEESGSAGSPGNKASALQVQAWIAEFHALRSEILDRMRLIHTVILAGLGGLGTLLGISLSNGQPLFALLVPFFTVPLALIYMDHIMAINHCGKYIQEEIVPRLSKTVGADVLLWESWMHHHQGRVYISHYIFMIAILLLSITVAPIFVARSLMVRLLADGKAAADVSFFNILLWVDMVLVLISAGFVAIELLTFKRKPFKVFNIQE